MRTPLLSSLLGALLAAAVGRANPALSAEPAWVAHSNANAKLLLDVIGKDSPERASELGLEQFDEQITDLSTRFGNLSDRFADTQKLLGAMQRMFAPLLGQADPYANPEQREAQDTTTNP